MKDLTELAAAYAEAHAELTAAMRLYTIQSEHLADAEERVSEAQQAANMASDAILVAAREN